MAITIEIKKMIAKSIDIHLHVGPEIIPRKYMTSDLEGRLFGKIAGVVLKNHFYPTVPFVAEQKKSTLKLYGSIVLNNSVGGLNGEAIYAQSPIAGGRPFFVWFPTIHTRQFLSCCEYEIAPEWVKGTFNARQSSKVVPVNIFDEKNRLVPQVDAVLSMIKQTGAVLATGHISWQESVALINRAARKYGLKKMVITHPIYQKIAMPIAMQKKLIKYGAYIEHCFSMHSIDKIPMKDIADQIKSVGPSHVILSSDVGQSYSPSPADALATFAEALNTYGISLADLETMLVQNPRKLLQK